MQNKKLILEKLSNPQDRFWISNTIDKYQKSEKNWSMEFTDFLDPYQQATIEKVFSQLHISDYIFEGGYEDAERKILIFDHSGNISVENSFSKHLPITALSILTTHSTSLSHRDFLGSILGLGIQRDKVGDIIINESNCHIIVMEDIADYIYFNLEKISRHKIKIERIQISDLSLPKKHMKTITTTVSSLRIDSIIAAGFGLSRGDAAKYLKSERVTVNWKTIIKPDSHINEGDTISVRGKGRLIIKECGHITKKGRIHIELERPL